MNFLTSPISFAVLIKENRTSANGEDMILKISPESIQQRTICTHDFGFGKSSNSY